MDKTAIYKRVQQHYGIAAKSTDTAFGYSTEELAIDPREANLGLSCGNPVALANLREVVSPLFLLLCLVGPILTFHCKEKRW
jgi:hypothetical protein